jgi:intracellular septation protein A
MLRILFKISLSWLLLGLYIVAFGVAYFVPDSFLAVAFDSGGVTTGPMTVPFIMALGVGVASSRSDKNAENDSFGLISLCSVGPILAVLILGMIYKPDSSDYVSAVINNAADSTELWGYFNHAFPEYFKEVAVALAPIVLFFFLFQIFTIKLRKTALIKITVGVIYTYLGLVVFLTGVNVGFMPIGRLLGQQLASMSYNWIIIPIGMIIGFFIVAAEPAVHVLNKQVAEISSGAIPEKALSLSLSLGVSLSVGLSLMRILFDVPLMYLLIPGYAIALALTFISYGCMIWAIFRSFSRNVYKRYQENHRFLLFFDRLKDREHRIFQCPRCRQMVRVPRGKGKIAITCPKCRERFIKKT